MQSDAQKVAESRDDLIYMSRIIMRWPRLGVCSPRVSQMLVECLNDQITTLQQKEPTP